MSSFWRAFRTAATALADLPIAALRRAAGRDSRRACLLHARAAGVLRID